MYCLHSTTFLAHYHIYQLPSNHLFAYTFGRFLKILVFPTCLSLQKTHDLATLAVAEHVSASSLAADSPWGGAVWE